MRSDWLYPLSSKSNYWFETAHGHTVDTGPVSFEEMIFDGSVDDEWGAAKCWRQMVPGDRMWVYYGTADGDLGIVGLASITGVTPSDPPDGHAVIKLAWNKPVTLRLLANPFPALAVRKHIPRPQGPAWRIGPALSQALLNHSKKGTSSSAAAKPTVAYGAGFSSNIPYTPPKAFTVHRRHDALLRPMMNRLESSGWRAVKFDVGSKKVDLAMGRGGKIILVEAKTFNESSSQAVRGAYAQLAEYAWKYCEINQASAKSILRWALFESQPTVDEIRFLEVKRPGLRDCSGYWVTASRAVVV